MYRVSAFQKDNLSKHIDSDDIIINHLLNIHFGVSGLVSCVGYKRNEITRQCESKCIR